MSCIRKPAFFILSMTQPLYFILQISNNQDSHSWLIKKRIDVDLSFLFSDISRELDFNPICPAVGVKK